MKQNNETNVALLNTDIYVLLFRISLGGGVLGYIRKRQIEIKRTKQNWLEHLSPHTPHSGKYMKINLKYEIGEFKSR
jgi:hypothetical protein